MFGWGFLLLSCPKRLQLANLPDKYAYSSAAGSSLKGRRSKSSQEIEWARDDQTRLTRVPSGDRMAHMWNVSSAVWKEPLVLTGANQVRGE